MARSEVIAAVVEDKESELQKRLASQILDNLAELEAEELTLEGKLFTLGVLRRKTYTRPATAARTIPTIAGRQKIQEKKPAKVTVK